MVHCRVRAAEAPGFKQDDWLNVFVLHQNRLQHGSSTKNTIREAYLARFLDLVVWGHEHECVLEPWVRTVSIQGHNLPRQLAIISSSHASMLDNTAHTFCRTVQQSQDPAHFSVRLADNAGCRIRLTCGI